MTILMARESMHTGQLQQRFITLVEPYRAALEWYCRSITNSEWEAEDLAQDTWLKAYSMYRRYPERSDMSKAYLFRIASNTRIDRLRKSQLPVQRRFEQELDGGTTSDPIEIWNAMEYLIAHLPPRQRAILLLIDVLQFTAAEVADMMQTTEGAIKSGLHRARTKLKQIRTGRSDSESPPDTPDSRNSVDEKVVYAYIEAFYQQNPQAMLMLYNDAASLDLVPIVHSRRQTRTTDMTRSSQWINAGLAIRNKRLIQAA